ncbi:hypothetical protein PHSC3_000467 [Chlamydiales bacterium STE3]|nr:hypothetical protein PHSC3_000467 [Chlamydiales bacterium STE3]
MLTVTKKNPFYKAICWFLTKPVSPNFKAHCIRKLEFASGAGSLACSTMASILHIATVIFAIVMVAPGPAFTAVVLTGAALAGMSILLAITFIVLKQGCFGALKQRPQMQLQNTQSNSVSHFNFHSPQLPHSNAILHNQTNPCLHDQEKEELKKEVKELNEKLKEVNEKLKEQTKRAEDWKLQAQNLVDINRGLRGQMEKETERKKRIRELEIEKEQLETRLKELEKENPIKETKDRSVDRSWTEVPPDSGSSNPNS